MVWYTISTASIKLIIIIIIKYTKYVQDILPLLICSLWNCSELVNFWSLSMWFCYHKACIHPSCGLVGYTDWVYQRPSKLVKYGSPIIISELCRVWFHYHFISLTLSFSIGFVFVLRRFLFSLKLSLGIFDLIQICFRVFWSALKITKSQNSEYVQYSIKYKI